VEEQIELVTDNGEPLARLASREELEAASSGWSDEGNGQAVKVPGGVHQVRLTYSSAPVERDR
jgi:hypothetical protein